MSRMFLTSEEVRELTERIQHASQAKVLNALGITHKVRPDGTVAVLRSHAEEVMSGGVTSKRKRAEPELNWGALNAARA